MKSSLFKFKGAVAALIIGAGLPLVAVASPKAISTFPGLPPSTLEKIGGRIGVETVVDNLFTIIANDNRINYIFLSGDTPELRAARKHDLVETMLGNPPAATPASESNGVDAQLTDTQLNAVLEDVYDAFENCRVSYHATNRVLGSLAPYEKSIVSTYVLPDLHPRAIVGKPVPEDAPH